jgi:predicted dithiol-disulfide oxidoreductase (DUF899 family)
MSTSTRQKAINQLEKRLTRDQEKLTKLKRALPREPVADYPLTGPKGPVKLSELFNGKPDLIVIHNMGTSCPYCTMWADGFNGLYPHLADRAGFVVISPDSPAVQKKFAKSRAWRFPMISGEGSTFIHDMGFLPKPDQPWPGVSTFQLIKGKIVRVASAHLGPFDPFCSVWPLIGLLAGGVEDWAPKYRY